MLRIGLRSNIFFLKFILFFRSSAPTDLFNPSDRRVDMHRESSTVYVVDDDESICRALKRLLRSADYQALTFTSAEDFLDATSGRIEGCLVLDIRLPGMSGLDLWERLISLGTECKIVFMSAHDNPQWRQRAMKLGAVAYLKKPFRNHLLLNAIRFGTIDRSKQLTTCPESKRPDTDNLQLLTLNSQLHFTRGFDKRQPE